MDKQPGEITYIQKGKRDLDLVGPLWEKLRLHHQERSAHFKEHFNRVTWEIRKQELLEKAKNGAMLVHLAKDGNTGKTIGYCVSTVAENKHAELESIYIEVEYRGHGIGGYFMKKAVEWMDSKAAVVKTLAIAAGNEEVTGFYVRYGFYPRALILMQNNMERA